MREITRRAMIIGSAAVGAVSALRPFRARALARTIRIGIVAKIRIPWFDNVEKGIKKAAEDLHVDAFMIAPTTNDWSPSSSARRRLASG